MNWMTSGKKRIQKRSAGRRAREQQQRLSAHSRLFAGRPPAISLSATATASPPPLAVPARPPVDVYPVFPSSNATSSLRQRERDREQDKERRKSSSELTQRKDFTYDMMHLMSFSKRSSQSHSHSQLPLSSESALRREGESKKTIRALMDMLQFSSDEGEKDEPFQTNANLSIDANSRPKTASKIKENEESVAPLAVKLTQTRQQRSVFLLAEDREEILFFNNGERCEMNTDETTPDQETAAIVGEDSTWAFHYHHHEEAAHKKESRTHRDQQRESVQSRAEDEQLHGRTKAGVHEDPYTLEEDRNPSNLFTVDRFENLAKEWGLFSESFASPPPREKYKSIDDAARVARPVAIVSIPLEKEPNVFTKKRAFVEVVSSSKENLNKRLNVDDLLGKGNEEEELDLNDFC